MLGTYCLFSFFDQSFYFLWSFAIIDYIAQKII